MPMDIHFVVIKMKLQVGVTSFSDYDSRKLWYLSRLVAAYPTSRTAPTLLTIDWRACQVLNQTSYNKPHQLSYFNLHMWCVCAFGLLLRGISLSINYALTDLHWLIQDLIFMTMKRYLYGSDRSPKDLRRKDSKITCRPSWNGYLKMTHLTAQLMSSMLW